jgi:transcriptional regulator with XRE-family HTH domain/quercetin dioxygenase-like cupin family protein
MNVNDPRPSGSTLNREGRVKDTVDVKSARLTGKQRRRPRLALDERATVERQNLRDDLGHRLREAREQKKIGLRELARRLGVSASLISQIETGKTEPSINTLFAIVSELELSVNEIVFDAKQDAGPPSGTDASQDQNGVVVSRRAGKPGPADAPESPVQRAMNRTSISLESGVSWQRLTAQPDHNVDFLLLRYPPGSESTPSHSLMRHNGTEYGYILSGRLQVSIGFDTYEIGPGDTIAFDCTQPHRFATIGDETVQAVWFVVGRRNTLSVDGSAVAP